MASRARTHRRDPSQGHYAQAVRVVLGISGVMLVLLGAVLATGGLLSPVNGSAFYGLAGLTLMVAGALVANRRRAGAWALTLVFVGTLTFALRNLGSGSPLPQRLVGPSLLLMIIALLLPVLCDWRPRRAAGVFIVMVGGTVALGIAASSHGPLARPLAALTRFLDTNLNGVLQ